QTEAGASTPLPISPRLAEVEYKLLEGAPGKGITMKTGDNRFAINLRGLLQTQEITRIQPIGPVTNDFEVSRARIFLSGHVYTPEIQYFSIFAFGALETEPDLRVPLLFGAVTYSHFNNLNVRAGLQVMPFDRASAIDITSQFITRSIVGSELGLFLDT